MPIFCNMIYGFRSATSSIFSSASKYEEKKYLSKQEDIFYIFSARM